MFLCDCGNLQETAYIWASEVKRFLQQAMEAHSFVRRRDLPSSRQTALLADRSPVAASNSCGTHFC
jgi:hypothetical protein